MSRKKDVDTRGPLMEATTKGSGQALRRAAQLLSRLTHKTLIPDILNIQMTSQMAIAATTTYRIH